MFDVRKDFPFLTRHIDGRPVIYLDNAATTQKPECVSRRVWELYSSGIANVHRAANFLADEVTLAFESSRDRIARFLGANRREIVFVHNATHALNLVAASYRDGTAPLATTTLEHHSNLLPWCAARRLFIPWNQEGEIDLPALRQCLARKPALVALSSASNFLGVEQPVADIVALCRAAGVRVLLDVSQSIAHRPLRLDAVPADYIVFSGHKLYAPGGTGVLYIRPELLEQTLPVFVGGSMVKEVRADSHTLNDIPHRFEAGTPNIEGVIGLGAAIDYLEGLGFNAIARHEADLVQYAIDGLLRIPGVRILGPRPGKPRAPLVSFLLGATDPATVARILSERANIVVRSGFLCAQPAHTQLGVGPSLRVSFAVYNTRDEVDCLLDVLRSMTRLLH
jgi:cysteine desulfurase/selenocysteine lyase